MTMRIIKQLGRTKGFLIVALGCFAAHAAAQEAARPEGAIRAEKTARSLFTAGEYEKAIPVLKSATNEFPDDLMDLSLLGMAYLYSSSHIDLAGNLTRAQETLGQVVDRGGEAVFLVGKGDDSLKSQIKFVVKAIQGELHLSKTSLSFTPSRGSAGGVGPLVSSDLKECALNKSYGKDSNTFHIKTSKETLNFRPLHFSAEESNLVCSLAAKYLGVKTAN